MLNISNLTIEQLVSMRMRDLEADTPSDIKALFQRVRRELWKDTVIWRARRTSNPAKFLRRLERLYTRCAG